jgi:hypothetical protein
MESDSDSDDDELTTSSYGTTIAIMVILTHALENSTDRRSHLSIEYRRFLAGTIRRRSLQDPTNSVFWKVYLSKDNAGLVSLCGLDLASFEELLAPFSLIYNKFSPVPNNIKEKTAKNGRRRSLPPESALGLTLSSLRTRGGNRTLCFLYAIVPASCSTWLRFGKRVLLKVLLRMDDIAVRMPTQLEVERYRGMISSKYPSLQYCWGAMDGLKLHIEASSDDSKQAMYYNGWKCDHFISNLFLFSPDGLIRASYFNCPGTFHDSTMARMSGIYEKVKDVFQATGGQVVVDSAFTTENASDGLIKSSQRNINRQGTIGGSGMTSQQNRDATSIRQLSEWGMRGLQGSFPKLKDRLPYEERGERKRFLQLVILVHNYRTSRLGLSQIQTTYRNALYNDVSERTFA